MLDIQESDIPFDLRHLRVISYDFRRAGWEADFRRSHHRVRTFLVGRSIQYDVRLRVWNASGHWDEV
jgi:hypothetical protein